MQYVVGPNFTAQTENGLIRLEAHAAAGHRRAPQPAPVGGGSIGDQRLGATKFGSFSRGELYHKKVMERPQTRIKSSSGSDRVRNHPDRPKIGPHYRGVRYHGVTHAKKPHYRGVRYHGVTHAKKQPEKSGFKRFSRFFGKSLLFLASGMLGVVVGFALFT